MKTLTPALLILLLVLAIYPAGVIGINRRNDRYIPSQPTPSNTTLLRQYLEDLRRLNDTNIDRYVEEIENAMDEGDYERVNTLLGLLKNYLAENYINNQTGINDPELLRAISYIMGTERVENNTVYIDPLKYLKTLANLTNNETINKLVEKLSENKGLEENEIEELTKMLSNITTGGFRGIKPGPIEIGGGVSSNPIPELPSAPPMVSPGVVSVPDWIPYLIPLIFLIAILYYYRSSLGSVLKPFSRSIRRTLVGVKVGFARIYIRRINDPVAYLIYEFISFMEGRGYRRYSWETLREYVSRIGIGELRDLGFKAIRLYEDRFFGGKHIDLEAVRRLRDNLRSVWRRLG